MKGVLLRTKIKLFIGKVPKTASESDLANEC